MTDRNLGRTTCPHDDAYYPELDAEYRRVISALLGRRPGGPPAVEVAARIAVNALHRASDKSAGAAP